MTKYCRAPIFSWGIAGGLAFFAATASGQDSDISRQLRDLKEQNDILRRQLDKQQEIIDRLNHKVADIENKSPAAESQSHLDEPAEAKKSWLSSFSPGKINLSGEGGVALFKSGRQGANPNPSFTIDEAKLFIEAPVWKDIYFFSEINFATREERYRNLDLRIGELYLDFENLSRFWNRENMLSLRAGRMDIPFGEEYLYRDAIDNPLISHSISDTWGIDEGIELYGAIGPISYVLAVQNGGPSQLFDSNDDKSVAARISYDPAKWLHLSLSGMRTGDMDARTDRTTELWFGNGYIRAIGNPATTDTFWAHLLEGDVRLRLPRGHLAGAGGYIHSDDNDSTANNRRDIYYYWMEGLFNITKEFYAASRFSQIFAPKGSPLVGNGDFYQYFVTELSTGLSRWSLGLGYHLNRNVLLKTEYTLEEGRALDGSKRFHQNLLGVEAAFKF